MSNGGLIMIMMILVVEIKVGSCHDPNPSLEPVILDYPASKTKQIINNSKQGTAEATCIERCIHAIFTSN